MSLTIHQTLIPVMIAGEAFFLGEGLPHAIAGAPGKRCHLPGTQISRRGVCIIEGCGHSFSVDYHQVHGMRNNLFAAQLFQAGPPNE